jgi:hypothetical protein
MARRIPRLDITFATEAQRAVQLAMAGERIRSDPQAGLFARREISLSHLEALYETAYFRIFLKWEDFLDQTFIRYLCGYTPTSGVCNLINSPFATINLAEVDVLGRSNFLNWADPLQVVARSRRYMTAGHHETVLNSNIARIIDFKSVRNRIAHTSEHARLQFDNATRTLAGKRYPGSSPGRFLRDLGVVSPVPLTWLEVISEELQNLATQIC